MRDVKIFARVNKLWAEISQRERRCEKSRLKPVTFSFLFPPRPGNFYINTPVGKTQGLKLNRGILKCDIKKLPNKFIF